MIKKDASRQVLKAISIGLSAALSLMPTVTAFAEDNTEPANTDNGQNEAVGQGETQESNENNDIKETLGDASDAVQTAEEAAVAYETANNDADTGSGDDAGQTGTETGSEAGGEEAGAESDGADAAAEGEGAGSDAANEDNAGEGSGDDAQADDEGSGDSGDDGGAEVQTSISEDLQVTGDVIDSLNQQVSALDQSIYAMEQAQEDYDAAATAADASISYADTKTEEASQSVDAAVDKTDETHEDATEQSETTATDAAVIYSDKQSADSAKATAQEGVEETQKALEESQAAVVEAETKLETASKALEIATSAVESAEKEKEEADAKEAEAKAKLKAILEDSDVAYTLDEEGNVTVTDDENLDSLTRKALESAQSAVDKARAEAESASSALAEAQNEEYEAVKAQAEAAQKLVEETGQALSEAKEAGSNPVLDEWIEKIKEQQEVIRQATDKTNSNNAKKTPGTVFHESGVLAAYLEAYHVAQWEGVDPSSVTVCTDFNDNSRNYWYITYTNVDSDVKYRVYVDVRCDLKNPGSVQACEHIITEYKPLSFGEDEAISDLTKGGEVIEVPEGASEEYKAIVDEMNEKLQNSSFNINDWKQKLRLTELSAKKYLADNYGFDVSSLSVPGWASNNLQKTSDGEYYMPVYYTDENGAVKQYYFFYSINNKEISSDGNTVRIYLKSATELGARTRDEYGNNYYEADFDNGTDAYQTAKQLISEVQSRYDEAVTSNNEAQEKLNEYNERIQAYEKAAADANDLAEKVKAARDKVVEAAEALKTARIDQSEESDKLAELKAALAEAQAEYDDAEKALEEANKKLEDIDALIAGMIEDIENGFKYRTESAAPAAAQTENNDPGTPSGADRTDSENTEDNTDTEDENGTEDEGISGGGSSEGGSGEDTSVPPAGTAGSYYSSELASAAAGTTLSGVSIETVGEAGGTEGSSGLSGAFARADLAEDGSSKILDSGAMPAEAGVLEEDVLGERMAPLIDAMENGTFTRGMMFTEDGLKLSFGWWLIITLFGIKGIQMYIKKSKREKAE